MVHLCPSTKHVTAEGLADLFQDKVLKYHGVPLEIVSDRDVRFDSHFWEQLFKEWGVKLCRSTSKHPQTDGQTEHANKVLEDMLRHFVEPRQYDWDMYLPMVEFAINNTYNSSIQTTPFLLNYGQSPNLPITASLRHLNKDVSQFLGRWSAQVAAAKKCLQAAQDRQKSAADKHRKPAPQFQPGDKVLIDTKHFKLAPGLKKKLAPRFVGPFIITRSVGPNNLSYRVHLPPPFNEKHPVFHVSSLRA